MEHKPLPIGIDNFAELIQKDFYYVDKTLFIKELIDFNGGANLFTRPRRFGKTLSLSMFQYFFEKSDKDNRHFFDNLAIMREGEKYLSHMGKYPVINITLKSAKQMDYQDSLEKIKSELSGEFRRHYYLYESDKLLGYQKEIFMAILNKTASNTDYSESLKFLSECLFRHHEEKVIILIDEYDVPLENAYFNGFYDEMVNYIRSLFESALKTNPFLNFSVITGCLRISKESIFTGLNNLEIISIMSDLYSEHFGFTEKEVSEMSEYYGITDKSEELKSWYDGYCFGDTHIYNPWSVINYVKSVWVNKNALPIPYWSNTSSNDIIRTLINKAKLSDRMEIESLIEGNTITKPAKEDITYGEITKDMIHLWNFLFFTGYLKKVSMELVGQERLVTMMIPNEEVLYIYKNKILDWFDENISERDLSSMYTAIMNGDTSVFQKELSDLLVETISFNDEREYFYHGFLLEILGLMKNYIVKSNRESGDGRTDIFIRHPQIDRTAVILELKVADQASQLSAKCEEALQQIEDKRYDFDLKQEGYDSIIKYGIAFYRKNCRIEAVPVIK